MMESLGVQIFAVLVVIFMYGVVILIIQRK